MEIALARSCKNEMGLGPDDAVKAVGLHEQADQLIQNTLSLISLQSLLVLLRSPGAKQPGNAQNQWLKGVIH